jgi:4-amino-4-deoxy-L-arabinose transferase-like glycosyltransferase
MLACVLLACVGTSWFVGQCVLLPQEARYAADWDKAQWVEASDGYAPVAYFRRVIDLGEIPDAAFVTVAADQIFSLYVNGALIGSNTLDFSRDGLQRAYMYDIVSLLRKGIDSIALRVKNVDNRMPLLRVSLGIVRGRAITYEDSGKHWLATTQSVNVYHRYSPSIKAWTTVEFDAGYWPPARQVDHSVPEPQLTAHPQLYEQPIASHWLSAGGGQDAYFLWQVALPFPAHKIWLRLAAIGTAHVFINGRLLIAWNGQAIVRKQNLSDYLSNDDATPFYRSGLAVGLYDISTCLHSGTNVIAVHTMAPGASAALVGLANLRAAISLDILVSDANGHAAWLSNDAQWRISPHASKQWVEGGAMVRGWQPAIVVNRPGVSRIFYLPEDATSRNDQPVPFALIVAVVLCCIVAVVALWLLLGSILRRFYHTFAAALAATSLAFLPALACETLLVVLFREPQAPPFFSYTWRWGLLLATVFALCYGLIWLHARTAGNFPHSPFSEQESRNAAFQMHSTDRIVNWLRRYWVLALIMGIAALLAFYDLAYEPLWQDELSSYYAAHGILMHGLPLFPSGFLYEKAELYSYLLAAWTWLFGDQGSAARVISALEYIMVIPLFYRIGCYFFDRHVSLLATAMLAFSPLSLIWGRQVRMYEQEQLLTMLVMYLCFKATQEQGRRRILLIYIAMSTLVIDYLTHEEMFIILPALVVCVMFASRRKGHLLPDVMREKHWCYAVVASGTILAIQWTLTRVTHPPLLGTDSSQRPFIQLTTENVAYYVNLLFFPTALHRNTISWMTMNSLLATLGCLLAKRSSSSRAKYCALFLLLSCLTLMLLFTMRADRYLYVLLPVYYLMGAYAVVAIMRAFGPFTILYLTAPRSTCATGSAALWRAPLFCYRPAIVALLCAAVLLQPALPLSNYSLFVSRLIGSTYHRHYPDYDVAGAYVRRHWRRGDRVISVVPDFCTYYYVGHADYFFSIDRSLFLLERNGHIIDTSIGATALLNQGDLSTVLAEHRRVWIVSDNGVYQAQVAKRFTFPADFHIVYEGYGTAVYFRDG